MPHLPWHVIKRGVTVGPQYLAHMHDVSNSSSSSDKTLQMMCLHMQTIVALRAALFSLHSQFSLAAKANALHITRTDLFHGSGCSWRLLLVHRKCNYNDNSNGANACLEIRAITSLQSFRYSVGKH